jgi:hypothetical protein
VLVLRCATARSLSTAGVVMLLGLSILRPRRRQDGTTCNPGIDYSAYSSYFIYSIVSYLLSTSLPVVF